jgi:hypothetical protein
MNLKWNHLLLRAFSLVLFACTQKLPAHSSGNSQGLRVGPEPINQINRSPDPIIRPSVESSSYSLDASAPASFVLTLNGEDAAKVYHLMAIAPEQFVSENKKTLMKTGKQFSCSSSSDSHYTCSIRVEMPKGSVKDLRAKGELLSSAPEMAQAFEENAYLRIEAPEQPGKIRLQVLDGFAEQLFRALKVDRTYDLIPDSVNGPGIRKVGNHLECSLTTRALSPTIPHYVCYFYLDTTLGTLTEYGSLS